MGDCIKSLVDEYIGEYRNYIKQHCLSYKNESSLEDAISRAAMSKMENGNRHRHQRRIPKECLEKARELLLKSKNMLNGTDSFEEIFENISSKIQPIKGIGDLAVYDIALRIGAHLDVYPNKVYLQRGSLEGAKALGRIKPKRPISPNELPDELLRLEPYEIEDFLCIYKNNLGGRSDKTNRDSCYRPTDSPRPCICTDSRYRSLKSPCKLF